MAQDHIVNQVTHDEGLGETEKGGGQDEEDTHCTLAPMSANKRVEVLEAGLHGHMAVLPSDTVLGQWPRKP